MYNSNFKYYLIFFGYVIIFSLFYYPFVSNELLPGRIDSWFNLGIFKHYANIINAYLTNSHLYIPNFPEGKVFLYGESSFFSGLVFWLLSLFFQSDLKTYIAFYILIQSLNAFSFAFFIKSFFKLDYKFAFIAGIFFSFSAFNLAFYDNIVYSIWFPLFFSLYFICNAKSHCHKNFIYAALSLYSLLYFSVYNFFMGVLVVLIFVCINYFTKLQYLKKFIFAFLLFAPLTIPFVYFYILNPKIPQSFNEYLTYDLIDNLGFKLKYLLKSFQSNYIYGSDMEYTQEVNYYWTIGWMGLSALLLSIIGLLFSGKNHLFFCLSLILFGIIFSFGPFWGSFISPSYFIYQLFPFLTQFKLIFKFYYLVNIGVVLLAIQGMIWLNKATGSSNLIILTITGLFLLENLPAKPIEYSTKFYYPKLSNEDLQALKSKKASTLFLPMCAPMFPEEDKKSCFVEGRAIEFRYLYWQAKLNINFLNGANGTIPQNRMNVNKIFDEHDFMDAIEILKKTYNLSHIFFDKTTIFSFQNPDLNELKKFIDYKEQPNYILFKL